MKRHDITAKADCATRSGGAFVAGVAMLSNPRALIRSLGGSA